MSSLIEGEWFSESEVLWPGQKFSLKVSKVLYQGKSEFQDILVFESETYGRVLVLDGVIQLTERDEFAYQEMITHLPLFSHACPKDVLIVGGGDGGVLREVARHDCVESIDMCEIDEVVVQVAKDFFQRSTASAYDDPRLALVHDDAAKYMAALTTSDDDDGTSPTAAAPDASASSSALRPAAAERVRARRREGFRGYDAIIVDSSDPVGPAESLFQPQFYEAMRAALAPNGIVCAQGECLWLHLPLIADVLTACGDIFPTVHYAYCTIPTYPSGQIGFVLCSLDDDHNAIAHPKRTPTDDLQAHLRYYTPAIHRAAFVLPRFAATAIEDAKRRTNDTDNA